MKKTTNGFTIVELLIVIVVIAVLAAITIVAYNGIQQRARASEASTALNQAKKKLALYKVDNSSYPTTGNLSSAGITDSTVTFQYTSDGSTYCLTATAANVSYKATDTTSPNSGGCGGHGQGGVAAVTNMEPNPNFETASMNSAGAGAGTRSLSTAQKVSGNNSTKYVWSSASSGVQTNLIAVSPSTNYNISMYIYVESGAIPGFMIAASDYATNAQHMSGVGVSGSWQRISKAYTTSSSQTNMRAWTTVSSASTFYIDAVMITQGSTLYNFADGSTLDWVWNGAANSSTSTGPAI